MSYKFVNRLLDLNFLRKALSYRAFLADYSKGFRLKLGTQPKKGRILVLAPHPDDDIFGCGGVLAKHHLQKDKVKIVYLTGDKKRKKEAIAATLILGINDLVFLDFEDGDLTAGKREATAIKKIMAGFKPDIIYAPFFLDSHPDHQATAKILKSTLKNNKFKGEIWSYEIWTPALANRIIKIDEVFTQKLEAIRAHHSQLKERGYLSAISGLAAYRAGMFGVGKRAEAFFRASSRLYVSIIEKYL